MRTRKLILILSFWLLFFVLVALMASPKILGISRSYLAFSFGALLIGSRVHSIKGRIKRWPYFLSLLALLFMLVALHKIFGISSNFFELFFSAAFFFTTISYFFVSSFFILPVAMKIYGLIQKYFRFRNSNQFYWCFNYRISLFRYFLSFCSSKHKTTQRH